MNRQNIKNNKKYSIFFLFLFGCIGSRILFSLMVARGPVFIVKVLGILYAILGVGSIVIKVFGLRKDKGAFQNKIWWDDLRYIHGILYITTSYLIWNQKRYAACGVILLDASISLGRYIQKRL